MITGWVYFMKPVGMPGPIKIGCSRVPKERLASLSVWSPFELELLACAWGDEKLERNVHDCFADQHRGREWFNPDPVLMAGIAAIAAGASLDKAFDLTARRGDVRRARRRAGSGWSAETRQHFSYESRLRWAAKRLRQKTGLTYWSPADLEFLGHPKRRLTEKEIARLEEVLSAPEAHFVTREQRWPKPVAVADPAPARSEEAA